MKMSLFSEEANMKRNISVIVVSGFFGSALLLILLSATGIVGARSGEIRSAAPQTNVVNTITTVDSAYRVGTYTSVTTGTDGLGLISYYDFPNGTLKVLHCGNATCNSGNISTTVDSSDDVGTYSSITIGADGLGLISYYDGTMGVLKVLHCGTLDCSSGNTKTRVDSAGDVGTFGTSITKGANGFGLISYFDSTHFALKVLYCGNAACNSGNISTTVDSTGNVGTHSSITLGAGGFGLVSYYDSTNGNLKVLHCGTLDCSSGNISTTVDSSGLDGSFNTSITLGADGFGLIAYDKNGNNGLKVLHCGNAACNSGNISTTIDSASNVGQYASIIIGADGRGLISYYAYTTPSSKLKVLHCGNVACSSGNVSAIVDSAGNVGQYTSITIGADGRG
jgi:preprotein translocase subunit Sec61beta